MFVLHANWHRHRLHLWAESPEAYRKCVKPEPRGEGLVQHAFAAGEREIRAVADEIGLKVEAAEAATLPLVLPFEGDRPAPSDRMVSDLGLTVDTERDLRLEACDIPTLAVPAELLWCHH